MSSVSSQTLLKLLAVILGIICLAGAVRYLPALNIASLTYYGERVVYMVNPSAERAYLYGLKHFDSGKPQSHNVDRAAYFFEETIALDPKYPYAHQQLARIQFLRGNFMEAIEFINIEIALQGDANPSAYYIRGLIKGFQGSYTEAVQDFTRFVKLNPMWAGYNDLAWVLMKSGQYSMAKGVLITGLGKYPDNAWLLNSYAIALFETGDIEGAEVLAGRAKSAVEKLTPEDWSKANPGNDPRIAEEGLATFRNATLSNLKRILEGKSLAEPIVH